MKKYKFCIFFLSFVIILNSCAKLSEGMTGTKRSKSSDEFLIYKKKPLVVPPDFEDMPSPKKVLKKEEKMSASSTSIEDLLKINKIDSEIVEIGENKSLEKSILKKIKNN